MGINLGFENAMLWWQGYSGLSFRQAKYKIKLLADVGDHPSIILLHCGGNDLGYTPLKKLRQYISESFNLLSELFPGVKIIWSEILPRNVWRYSSNNIAMENSRKRINGYAGGLAMKAGGAYLRHPKLCDCRLKFNYLKNDGVHLNLTGNECFLNQLRNGIMCFLNGQQYIA